ncbi:MAG: cold shock domain-containing protein [Lentimicrobium sp.]|nr:cold shock domain-containing protein [Lentimicrobium sp.]
MARSQQTWNKIENEKKKIKKKKDKAAKKLERSTNTSDGNNLDDMIAYVDEYGRISDTPPDPLAKKVIKAEDIEVGVRKKEDMDPVDENRTGIVTFFNDSKGFGFIKDLATGDSVFVHIKELEEPIKENNKVTFKIERGPKGLNAIEVKIVR